jgi:hypothetical protein
MARQWTDTTLDAARREGDREADDLVADILVRAQGTAQLGRLGYNALLDLADLLVASPELMLVKGSILHGELGKIAAHNPRIVGYFDPIEAPDWVDEAKLARAAELWETDALLSIAVLYAASLPACYLMQKGVPVLYGTDKLARHDYIFQRIHETGLMLDAVLDQGGIKVIRDVSPDADRHLQHVLARLDPAGGWEWKGRRLQRAAGAYGPGVALERVRTELAAAFGKPKRYLWGKGCVSAKKVRFLHASMRCMLMNPAMFHPVGDREKPQSLAERLSHVQEPWDVAKLGVPINQEDQAFVLLTFGYLIPKGMEHWGRTIPRDQKEGFLHLWKVIGHIMGIRADLMTDDLEDAAALYERILARNGGPSEPGVLLTEAVMEFLEEYLPGRFGLAQRFPAELIIDQLGPDRAQMILRPERFAAARRFFPRLGYGACRFGVWAYYRLRDRILARIPLVAGAMAGLLHRSAEMLIESWRDTFQRKPFYVPAGEKTWVRKHGVTPEYKRSLMAWRVAMFDTLLVAVASIIVAGFAVGAAIVFAVLLMWKAAGVSLGVAVLGAIVAAFIMKRTLPAIFDRRPRIPPAPSVEAAEEPEPVRAAA